jgi:hypothetical protein
MRIVSDNHNSENPKSFHFILLTTKVGSGFVCVAKCQENAYLLYFKIAPYKYFECVQVPSLTWDINLLQNK